VRVNVGKALGQIERKALAMFSRAMPIVSWAFFIVGVLGAVGTAAGILPPYSSSLWAKLTTILLWLLFAREGYDALVEDEEDEHD
jgi:hypothetical protein